MFFLLLLLFLLFLFFDGVFSRVVGLRGLFVPAVVLKVVRLLFVLRLSEAQMLFRLLMEQETFVCGAVSPEELARDCGKGAAWGSAERRWTTTWCRPTNSKSVAFLSLLLGGVSRTIFFFLFLVIVVSFVWPLLSKEERRWRDKPERSERRDRREMVKRLWRCVPLVMVDEQGTSRDQTDRKEMRKDHQDPQTKLFFFCYSLGWY